MELVQLRPPSCPNLPLYYVMYYIISVSFSLCLFLALLEGAFVTSTTWSLHNIRCLDVQISNLTIDSMFLHRLRGKESLER